MDCLRGAPGWAVLIAVGALVGCDDCGDPPGTDGDAGPTTDGGGETDGGDASTPTGEATLTFQAIWGAGARMQIDPEWRDDVPGWEPDAPLVVMLCATDDPTCESPVVAREVTAEESDGAGLGAEDGPTVTIEGLPEGDFLLVVMADSAVSRAHGFGWDDGFETTETAWGGHASEGDLLVSDPGDAPSVGHNPAVVPVAVTLSADAPTEAGTLVLGHFHERDVSPAMEGGSGVLAVAVDGGLRLVDLSTLAPMELPDGGTTAVMTDDGTASGTPFDGTVCGLVEGPASTVFLLYRDPAGGGFAVQYDVTSRSQLNDGYRVLLPGIASDTPCRGLFHQFGGEAYLFVANAPAAPDEPAGDGLWYARVGDLFERDVTGTFMGQTDDTILGVGVGGMAAQGDRIFLAMSPESGDGRVAEALQGTHMVLVGELAVDGRPTLRDAATFARVILRGPARGAAAVLPDSTVVPCDAELGTAGLAVAEHHDGTPLLFLGGCLEIAAFDLSADPPTRLDFNGATAGEPNLVAPVYGQAFASFALSPDGSTLWAIPQRRSPYDFFVETEAPAPIELDRRMALPIDLSAGDLPEPDATVAEDVDGYSGHPSGGLDTPAEDPGLDLGFVAYQRYLLDWAPSLGGETFAPAIELDGLAAVSTDTGLFAVAPGGLGKASDISTYDVAARRGHLWPHDGSPFYGIWTGGPDAAPPFGFDVDTTDDPTPVHGVVYVE